MSSSPSTSTADSIFFAHSIISCHHVICSQCVQLCAGNSIHTCDASKNAMRQNHLQPTMGCGKLVKRTEAPQRTSAPCAERNATPVRMGRTMARKNMRHHRTWVDALLESEFSEILEINVFFAIDLAINTIDLVSILPRVVGQTETPACSNRDLAPAVVATSPHRESSLWVT